jgi:hypothetical protein
LCNGWSPTVGESVDQLGSTSVDKKQFQTNTTMTFIYGYNMTTKAAQIANRYFYCNPGLLKHFFPKGGSGINSYILENDLVLKIREHSDMFPGCLNDFELDEVFYTDAL